MPLEPIGVLDLSIVTGLLCNTLNTYWNTAPLWQTLSVGSKFTPNVSGLTPDSARLNSNGQCQVTLSLIHIEPDRYNRNFVHPPPQQPPVQNPPAPRAQMIPALPLALDLFYFVTAWADGNATQEQQAISIALNCFHQNPIIRTNVTFPGSPPTSTQEEFTLTMEIESVDSISRFWQALTVPFRLSLMYKVAVVFLTPPAPPVTAKQVERFGVAVEPAAFPLASNGQLFGTSSSLTFVDPNNTASPPSTVDVNYSPATVVPGQRFFLYGTGLNQGTDYSGAPPNPGTSYRVFLALPPDYKTQQEVTAWKTADIGPPSNAIQTGSRVVLDLPTTVGALPANAPQPGVYQIAVGSTAPGDAITYQSNPTPFSVAAKVSAPAPPALPIIKPTGGLYTVTGIGFAAGQTELLLDTDPLTAVTGAPGSGQFRVVSSTKITFRTPVGLATGKVYSVRVRVNQVESPPALWIQL